MRGPELAQQAAEAILGKETVAAFNEIGKYVDSLDNETQTQFLSFMLGYVTIHVDSSVVHKGFDMAKRLYGPGSTAQ